MMVTGEQLKAKQTHAQTNVNGLLDTLWVFQPQTYLIGLLVA